MLGIWRIPAFGGTPKLITPLETPDAQSAKLKYWSAGSETIYYGTDKDLFRLDTSTGKTTRITSLNSSDQFIRHFAISQSEDRIAYIDVKEDRQDIWVMPMAGGQPQQVTDDIEEDLFPVWHPDGKRIIYSSKRDGIFQVCVADVAGNRPAQITFGDSDSFVSDVSSDGTRILYSGAREESDVDVKTGEESQITVDVAAELWPDISPDGKSLAFQSVRQLSQASNIDSSAIFNKPLEGEGRQIQLALGAMAPEWSPDGKAVAFLRTSGSATDIWTVSAVGGNETRLTRRGISGFAFSALPYNRFNTRIFSWSPDSSKISYCSEIPEIGIWVSTADGQNEVEIVSTADENTQLSSPCWSPDGHRLAYLSRTEGEKTIWSVGVVDLTTRKPRTVYQVGSVLRLLGWSSAGDAILVATIEDRPNVWPSPADVKLLQISVENGAARLLAVANLTYLYNTRLSPDGRMIAVVARRDGKDNIWLAPVAGGEIKRVTVNTDPRFYLSAITWSPDAKKIYFDKQSRYSLISLINNFR
jgi:Tol biopolymer transport system component